MEITREKYIKLKNNKDYYDNIENNTELNTLGKRIKASRKLCGFSQVELAVEVGIDRAYLSNIERDIHTPSTHIINALAISLNKSIDWLINGSKNNIYIVDSHEKRLINAFRSMDKEIAEMYLKIMEESVKK